MTTLTIGAEDIDATLEQYGAIAVMLDFEEGLNQAQTRGPQFLLVHLLVSDSKDVDLGGQHHALPLKTLGFSKGPKTNEAWKSGRQGREAGGNVESRSLWHEHASQLRAVLRRATLSVGPTVCFGDVEVNFERRQIRRRGKEVTMTRTEYNLLAFFLRNSDRALTRETILKHAWGYRISPQTRTVDAHVVKLRQKLELDPGAPRHFFTIHSVGYRFVMNPD